MLKKLSIVLVLILVLGAFTGCKGSSQNQDTSQKPATSQQPDTREPSKTEEEAKGTNVGGFYLDQPADDITKTLGKADSVKTVEEGYYGEPYDIWEYKRENGDYMNFVIGKNTKKVLDFTISVPGYRTDLGIELGSSYDEVANKYGSFKNVVSNQDGSELAGWYDLNNGQIIIFDFDRDDESTINENLKPESKVESIRVSRFDYFD